MSDFSQHPLFSRRLFLTRGVQLLSVAGTLPLFLDRSARCLAADFAANPLGAGRPDRILVVVQLAGGNDGLNTVVPIRNDDYYRARPRIGIAKKDALATTDDFGFHPSMTGMKQLYDAGNLAVLHAVGYPNPNRSHFRSTDIWATGEPEKVSQTGWLGRYCDNNCCGADPGPQAAGQIAKADRIPEPSAAIALTTDPPVALQGQKFLPITFRTPDSLTFAAGRRDTNLNPSFDQLNDVDPMMAHDPDHKPPKDSPHGMLPMGTSGSLNQNNVTEQFLQRSALNARVYADTIKKSTANVQNKAKYPNSRLASDLKLTAQMISSGFPTRVYYVQMGGFDTHSGQAPRHEKLLSELSSSLAAFAEDLKLMGHFDRTTVMTFSEFGRRVGENGSGGTDHGEAAPMFVMGGKVKPGFIGTPPDLSNAKLHRGDVAYSLDFRRLYATVLRDWLKCDDTKVLGQKFEPIKLYKA